MEIYICLRRSTVAMGLCGFYVAHCNQVKTLPLNLTFRRSKYAGIKRHGLVCPLWATVEPWSGTWAVSQFRCRHLLGPQQPRRPRWPSLRHLGRMKMSRINHKSVFFFHFCIERRWFLQGDDGLSAPMFTIFTIIGICHFFEPICRQDNIILKFVLWLWCSHSHILAKVMLKGSVN